MTEHAHAGGTPSGRALAPRVCLGVILSLLKVGAATAAVSCSISVTPLSFGTYDVFSAIANDSTGTISVSCTQQSAPVKSLPVSVSLTKGSSGSYASRQMKNGVNILTYNMFTNATRTTIFGDGSAGTSTVGGTFPFTFVGQTLTGTATIYGRIPAGQDVSIGSYADTITATVTF
jgi:spore coat protein U-like protein